MLHGASLSRSPPDPGTRAGCAATGLSSVGATTPSGRPRFPDGRFAAVAAGGSHSCGLRADRSVTCWGGNWAGQPAPPRGEFAAVSAGSAHSCGLRADGAVACWGEDQAGQLAAPGGEFEAVSAGRVSLVRLAPRRDRGVLGIDRRSAGGEVRGAERRRATQPGASHRRCGGLLGLLPRHPSWAFSALSVGRGHRCAPTARWPAGGRTVWVRRRRRPDCSGRSAPATSTRAPFATLRVDAPIWPLSAVCGRRCWRFRLLSAWRDAAALLVAVCRRCRGWRHAISTTILLTVWKVVV